jgi:protein tyrosine/serine phosphatase
MLSVLGILGAIVVMIALYLVVLDLSGNVHEVAAGTVYRSGQLTPTRLSQVVRQYGIVAVLNLRGPNPGKDWYDHELAACATLGIRHLDVAWSAQHEISLEQCADLEHLIDDAPKPLLIHCQAGADRTGLASSIYLLTHGASAERASGQLALRYLHFPYLGSKTRAMDLSFDRYARFVQSRTIGTRE